MADTTVTINVVDRSVPPMSTINIAVINQPNPVTGYSATGQEVWDLIQISKYFVTDEAGTPINGSNFYDYFPDMSPGGGGGGGGYVLPTASDSVLGGVKIGDGVDIDSSGKISVSGGSTITVDDAMSDSSENPVQNKVITNAMADKVDVVSGKGLSTEDFTTAEKNKLSGIADNANNYSLPTASSNTLGGVKVGTGLSIDGSGVLSVTVDSELDTTSENPVQNKVIAGVLGDINTVLEGVL